MTEPQDPYNTPNEDSDAQPPRFPTTPGQNEFPVMPRPELPKTITNAVRLMYVGAGLAALGVIALVLSLGSLRDDLAAEDPTLTGDELDVLYNGVIAFGLVLGIVAIGLWVWMAEMNKRGKSWARIVATVLGGLNIVLTLSSLGFASGLDLVLNLISIGLAGAIIWLLYRPDSKAYYQAVSSPSR